MPCHRFPNAFIPLRSCSSAGFGGQNTKKKNGFSLSTTEEFFCRLKQVGNFIKLYSEVGQCPIFIPDSFHFSFNLFDVIARRTIFNPLDLHAWPFSFLKWGPSSTAEVPKPHLEHICYLGHGLREVGCSNIDHHVIASQPRNKKITHNHKIFFILHPCGVFCSLSCSFIWSIFFYLSPGQHLVRLNENCFVHEHDWWTKGSLP